MSGDCRGVRRLLASREASGTALADHLASCERCARFAERYSTARQLLRDHQGRFEPDRHFADRVAARLPSRTDAAWGWAMARVLPATVVLMLVLMWLSWIVPVNAPTDETSPTDDVLAWVIDQTGEDR